MPQRRSEPLGVAEGYGIVLKAGREPKLAVVPGVAGNAPSSSGYEDAVSQRGSMGICVVCSVTHD